MVKIADSSSTACAIKKLECIECDEAVDTEEHYLLENIKNYNNTFKILDKYYTVNTNQCIGIHKSCCQGFHIFSLPNNINILTHSAGQ